MALSSSTNVASCSLFWDGQTSSLTNTKSCTKVKLVGLRVTSGQGGSRVTRWCARHPPNSAWDGTAMTDTKLSGATGLRRVSVAAGWRKSRISRGGSRKLGISSFARLGGGGSSRGSAGGGDASTLLEMATLVEDLSRLNGDVSEGYKGIIGADMRSRVDILHQRAALLKQSAVRVVAEGGSLPVQLTAALKALQRDHASVENIVRMAMDAGPIIMVSEDPPPQLDAFDDPTKPPSRLALKEEQPKAPSFESLILESSIAPVDAPAVSGTQEYVMSSAAATDDSSPLAAFRKEIERRVMEQLVGTKDNATEEQDTAEMVTTGDDLQPLLKNHPSEGVLGSERVTLGAAAAADGDAQSDVSEVTGNLSSSLGETENGSRLSSEVQLLRLEEEMSSKVKLNREALVEAQMRIAQVTGELRRKEAILVTVKEEYMAEQGELLEKIRVLSGELSMRVTAEEVEAAVNNAVRELEKGLESALERAEGLRVELEKKENLLVQLRKQWDVEKTNLREELFSMKERIVDLEKERFRDKTKLSKAIQKVNALENSVCKLQEAVVEAEEERVKKEKNVLATVRSLVTDMVKARRAKSSSGTIDSTGALDALLQQRGGTNTMQRQQETDVEDVLGSILNSGEKALALETFFVIMAVLIKQESEKFETNNPDLETLTEDKSGDNGGTPTTSKISNLEQLPRDVDSSKGNTKANLEHVITLYYDSSWEFAYLHYCADNSQWTELPGACMHNGVVVNKKAFKGGLTFSGPRHSMFEPIYTISSVLRRVLVINVLGSSLEFVLTDGKGSWDWHPLLPGCYRSSVGWVPTTAHVLQMGETTTYGTVGHSFCPRELLNREDEAQIPTLIKIIAS